jgi:hypothetical protein
MDQERYLQLVKYDEHSDGDKFRLWLCSPDIVKLMASHKRLRVTNLILDELFEAWQSNPGADLLQLWDCMWDCFADGVDTTLEKADVSASCAADHNRRDPEDVTVEGPNLEISEVSERCSCPSNECEVHTNDARQFANRELARGLFSECLNRDLAGLIAKMI